MGMPERESTPAEQAMFARLRRDAQLIGDNDVAREWHAMKETLERIVRQCQPGAGECPDCERAQRWAATTLEHLA